MGFDQMMNDEEFGILVEGYCRKIKRVCDEIIYIDNSKVLDKVAEITKLANRAQEIKGMREAQKTTGEEEK